MRHLYYLLENEQVMAELNSRPTGLSSVDAVQRLKLNGPNQITQTTKDTPLKKYLRQFQDLMIWLLMVSGILAAYLGDIRTGIVLFVLVLFNTLIGFKQEYAAEKLMDSLEKLVHPVAKVYRDGKLCEVASTDLVSGDIVYVEEGDSVPADLRIVTESELSTNDFALTGESNPSKKFAHAIGSEVELAARHNLCYMGTTIATGKGTGVVVAVAMNTELGRIATLSQEINTELSPLQKETRHIAKNITIATVGLSIPLVFISIYFGNLGLKAALLFAVGFASSLIPQGLPAEINTALAQAASTLAKAKALVKKLSAVETLGATSVICTDKTGTLTKNQMTVEQVLLGNTSAWVTGRGYETNGTIVDDKGKPIDSKLLEQSKLLFQACVFASNATVSPPDDNHGNWFVIGDPTEGAMVTLAQKAGYYQAKLDIDYPEIKQFSFDSARKRMSSFRKIDDVLYVFVKGAPEAIFDKTTHELIEGKVSTFTAKLRSSVNARNELLAKAAMRNIALAYKVLPLDTDLENYTIEQAETGLTFLGMVSMIDPPREEVADAITAARRAQIPIAIITGDNALTAQAIGLKIGLATKASDIKLILGADLKNIEDNEIFGLLKRGAVIFSRVAPEDKLRIVEIGKKNGMVVAVTGDGINDAPALKRADIGVAMGITGTDVAKQAAEIVLLDDSFHTLVSAIGQGRTIYHNIKKGALSCFSSNAAELMVNLLSLGFATVLGFPLAISVMQILAIDLIAELFPIAALGNDPEEADVLGDKPRNLHDHILNKKSVLDLAVVGILMGGFAYLNYILFFVRSGYSPGSIDQNSSIYFKATTITYLTIVICQLLNIMQRRSVHGLFTRYQLKNKTFWQAIALSLFCVANIIYNPWISKYFGSAPLNIYDWLYTLGFALIFISIREAQRLYTNTKQLVK
jgi:P-type Ca2+ transporter type 2C